MIVGDADNLINNNIIVGNSRKNGVPFLFRGVGLVLSILIDLFNLSIYTYFNYSMTSDPENPLLIDVLSASNTAYTYKPDEKIVDVRHFKICYFIFFL